MPYYTNNDTNRLINAGNLPHEKLFPAPASDISPIDFHKEAGAAYEEIRDNPEFFAAWMRIGMHEVRQREAQLGLEDYRNSDVNVYINTGFNLDGLPIVKLDQTRKPVPTKVYSEACALSPVVTFLDKVFFANAYGSFIAYETSQEPGNSQRHYSLMCFWIQLLLATQEKETKYGKTICKNAIESIPLEAVLSSDWELLEKEQLTMLNSQEKQGLITLIEHRKNLQMMAGEKLAESKAVADETQSDWELFITLVNHWADEEEHVIKKILTGKSSKEKLNAISKYENNDKMTSLGKATIYGRRIQFNPLKLANSITRRVCFAPAFTNVFSAAEKSFRITYSIVNYCYERKTYNSFFIQYHRFRMNPCCDTATSFISMARSCLEANLGFETSNETGINTMLCDIHSGVIGYIRSNKEIISELSYSEIQQASVLTDHRQLQVIQYDSLLRTVFDHYDKFEEKEREQIIQNVLTGNDSQLASTNQLGMDDLEAELDYSEKETRARQIVVSLNILFLLCNALQIMLDNPDEFEIKDPVAIGQVRRELAEIENEVFHSVYSKARSGRVDVSDYRQLNTQILSKREENEELLRNEAFVTALKNSFSELARQIDGGNEIQIAEIKKQINERLKAFPDCEAKENLVEWVDQISCRICSALVENCKRQSSSFLEEKETIKGFFGEIGEQLPSSTIDSLTTAELLYEKYATKEFESTGFDYSCISSLYYQAFEDAYNALIWRDYASYLNSLTIKNGTPFVNVLEKYKHKTIEDNDALGYLDKYSKTRDFYVEYAKKDEPLSVTQVRSSCMYKSFSILMSNLRPNSYLSKYCDYFARKAGYLSKREMINDTQFVRECTEFISLIDKSVDARNNASHGETAISLDQCSDDKNTVLYGTKQAEEQRFGLIQQMLFLLFRDKTKS